MSALDRFGIAPSSYQKLIGVLEATPGLARVWIYGSRARGTARNASDIDLALEVEPTAAKSNARVRLDVADRLEALGLLYRVDMVCLDDRLDAAFRSLIERDRQLFWEPQRHVLADAPGSMG